MVRGVGIRWQGPTTKRVVVAVIGFNSGCLDRARKVKLWSVFPRGEFPVTLDFRLIVLKWDGVVVFTVRDDDRRRSSAACGWFRPVALGESIPKAVIK